jgi:uncharacterized membrane protein YedE/YeeE
MKQFIMQPWPWWFSGAAIALIMLLLLLMGKPFSFSSNLRTICSMAGAGRRVRFFNYDWKAQSWNLFFLLGAILGGYIAGTYLSSDLPVSISADTIQDLSALGVAAPQGLQPDEIFSLESAFSLKGFLFLAWGGLFIGFGTRYAGGCTSGHAISGISNLQLPSLISVIGFFIGGLIMTHFIFPLIF